MGKEPISQQVIFSTLANFIIAPFSKYSIVITQQTYCLKRQGVEIYLRGKYISKINVNRFADGKVATIAKCLTSASTNG